MLTETSYSLQLNFFIVAYHESAICGSVALLLQFLVERRNSNLIYHKSYFTISIALLRYYYCSYDNLKIDFAVAFFKSKIKSSLYSSYYAEACNELRGPSPRLSAWATQLRRNVATMASRWRRCVDLTGPVIEPQTSRTDSVRLATELMAGLLLFLLIKCDSDALKINFADWRIFIEAIIIT